MTTLYESIIMLDESQSVSAYITLGDMFQEADDNTQEQEPESPQAKVGETIVNTIRGNSDFIEKNLQAHKKFLEELKNANKGNKLKKLGTYIKIVGLYIAKIGATVFGAILKLVDKLWELLLKIPFVKSIADKLKQWFFTNKEGEIRKWKVGETEVPMTEVFKIAVTGFVLGGLAGKIIKYLKTRKQEVTESLDIVFTEPMVLKLSEAEGDIQESFLSKGPTVISNLVNFLKNVKDKAVEVIITLIGTLVAISVFFLALVLMKPLLCKAIKFAAAVKHGISNNEFKLQGAMWHIKYTLASLIYVPLLTLEKSKKFSGYLQSCECIDDNGTFENKGDCATYYTELKEQIQQAGNKEENNQNQGG